MASVDAYVGEKPAYVVWTVVSGDDASLDFAMTDANGIPVVTAGWSASAQASNVNGEYVLNAEIQNGVITVEIASETSSTWGVGSETDPATTLRFAIQVVKATGMKWTPVIGKIVVLRGI